MRVAVFEEEAAAADSLTADELTEDNFDDDNRVSDYESVINGEKLNFLAMAAAGIIATKLTIRQRTVLSLFLATVSTALANIAFADESKRRISRRNGKQNAAETQQEQGASGC